MRCVWWLCFVAVLTGCIPYSDNPLTEPGKECLDPAILGTWFVHEEDETVFLHMGVDGKSKGLRVVMVEFQKDGEVKTSELTGHTSRLGEKTYLNLRWDRPAEQETGYLFVKYQVTGEGLGIGLIQTEAVEKVIRAGALRGEIVEGQWVSSVKLTDSSERLREYFQKHDKELFEELKLMNPLNLPEGSAGASAGQGTGEVSILQRQGLSETIYALGDASCEVTLTAYESELNLGVIDARSKCALSWERQVFLFEKVLRKVLEDEKQANAFHTLFWGRLVPDLPEGPREMSYRLALAASDSPLWDKKKGRAKAGHENACVVELANQADIYRELTPIFASLNRTIRFSSAEKVLITEAEKLPFFEELKKHGVQPKDRLPFDCLTWFSVSELKTQKN